MARLDGKVAIITGAASGFGEGMARRFAEECPLLRDGGGFDRTFHRDTVWHEMPRPGASEG